MDALKFEWELTNDHAKNLLTCSLCHRRLNPLAGHPGPVNGKCSKHSLFCLHCLEFEAKQKTHERSTENGVVRGYDCPVCKTFWPLKNDKLDITKLGTNGPFCSILSTLMVKCTKVAKDASGTMSVCGATHALQDHAAHVRYACRNEPQVCRFNGCTMKLPRWEMKLHEKNCEFDLLQCSHCGEEFRSARMRRHVEICKQVPVCSTKVQG